MLRLPVYESDKENDDAFNVKWKLSKIQIDANLLQNYEVDMIEEEEESNS